MKWIGQHIYDQVSRFRNSVYVNGDYFYVTSDNSRFISTEANDPLVQIRNERADANGARLRFMKQRLDEAGTTAVDGVDNDVCGTIEFYSYDDGTPSTQNYAQIQGTIHDATSGEESGKLTLGVASHDGGVETGLTLTGGNLDEEVDVIIGNGTSSDTTIAGNIKLVDGATIQSAGDLNITAVGDDITVDTDFFNIISQGSNFPKFYIKASENAAANAGMMVFSKDRGVAAEDGDKLGTIAWVGEDAGQNLEQYATITCYATETADGDEAGSIVINVVNDGTERNGITMTGDKGTAQEVDVTIANGAASTTTIAGSAVITGNLTMGSTDAMTSAGLLVQAGQTNITSVGTLTGLTTSGAIELGHASDTTVARSAAGVITVEGKEVRTVDRNIQIIHSSFRDDIGTTAHYIPWHSTSEKTTNTNEEIPFVAPYAGKLLELHYRASKNLSGATATWELVQILKTETVSTGNNTTLDTQTCTGPTNAGGSDNVVKVTFDADAAFSAGDMLALKLTHDSDVTDSNTKFYITTIWEYDLSSM